MNSLTDAAREAIEQLCALNADRRLRRNRQNWLDLFQSPCFLDAQEQTEFRDAVLAFLRENPLESRVLRDFCRAFRIKEYAARLDLEGEHPLIRHLVGERERLLAEAAASDPDDTGNTLLSAVAVAWIVVQGIFLIRYGGGCSSSR